MKKEELDKLKENYWSGKSSLEEEKILKDQLGEPFFHHLKKDDTTMDWDFEDFIEKADHRAEPQIHKPIFKLNRKVSVISAIAASLIVGFYFFKPTVDQENWVQEPEMAHVNNRAIEEPKAREIAIEIPDAIASINENQNIIEGKQHRIKSKLKPAVEQVPAEQAYVEVNGVKIYDEEEALQITETAIHLASNNLKAGMKGVEKIKYLNIEI
ncbi:hypothetical protein ACFRAE_02520 [Sphingobacterium sp. HJSM2_6]|uniref:hypothetical protein n=1 Tax=Sphingobacterium sp. HJSM2_6 TaxID=3366264 RepID=UPI003BC07584